MSISVPLKNQALKASVILFPGQGSQYVGMVKNLSPKGKSLFEVANQVLGYDLLHMCKHGPEEELNKTIHSQPAMLVSSLAAVENLAEKSTGAIEKCVATAGFSVGEFASLVLAQSIDFVEALKLIKLRAEVTQIIGDSVPGGMMTILYGKNGNPGQACQMAREYCIRSGLPKDESVCSIANHLFPHAKVLGGHQVALEFIEHNFKDFGIKRLKRLAVSGAFHTSLMKSAANDLKKALANINIREPKIKVYSNVSASLYQDVAEIKSLITQHVHKPVLWEQLIQNLYSNVRQDSELPITFECGPGNNMTTILGMINLKAKKLAYNIDLENEGEENIDDISKTDSLN